MNAPADGTGGNGATTTDPTTSPTASNGGSGGGGGGGGSSPTAPTPEHVPHHHCGWINDNVALGTQSLIANADFFDAIHPYFWTLTSSGTFSTTSFTDDATIVSTAQAHHIALMPLLYGGDDPALIRNVIASPAAIAAHVSEIVNIATQHNYDGVELDYEHLWLASDRAGYTALVQQLGAALHAAGKQLSLAVPAIAVDNGQNGYDYAALAAAADVVHLMGYDYHGLGSPHAGPLAPIGWIDAVAARVQSLGIAQSFVLGIANYGVGSNWYDNSANIIQQCGGAGSYATDDGGHMQTCSFGVYTAGLSPHCTTSRGDVWFEDGASIAQKAQTAKAHGLRGVAYYTLGGEPAGALDGMRAAYP